MPRTHLAKAIFSLALVPEGLDIHVVADNYGTHKTPTIKAWLAVPAPECAAVRARHTVGR